MIIPCLYGYTDDDALYLCQFKGDMFDNFFIQVMGGQLLYIGQGWSTSSYRSGVVNFFIQVMGGQLLHIGQGWSTSSYRSGVVNFFI